MLLAREFVRLAALEALRPSALLDAPAPVQWPTIADTLVFDSAIPPLDDLIDSDERKHPIVSVYTENAALSKIAQAGPMFYRCDIDLVFEISVVAQMVERDENGEAVGDPFVGYTDTDAGVEAMLGSLEDQIFHALNFGPTGAMFRSMVKRPFDEWHSTTRRSGEENSRIARRAISARIAIKEVCYAALPDTVATGLDRLPPALRTVAQQLGPSTYLHDLALGMAKVAPQMPVRTLLENVGMTIAASRISAVPTTAAEAENLQGD